MLTSTPKDPTQPSTQFYNIDALYTVSLHTRGGTEANNGPQPPFDMSQGERNWWDDSATGPKSYIIFDNAAGAFVTKTIDARKPNFKGFPNYPKRPIAGTSAVMPHATGTPTPVDPATLSTDAEAKALQAELGGTGYLDTGLSSQIIPVLGQIIFPIDYKSESRREWAVMLSTGKQINVGQALADKNKFGSGFPGKWVADSTNTSGLDWIPDRVVDGGQSTLPAVPPPCRALLPTEKLVSVAVGGLGFSNLQIERTDLTGPTTAGTGSAGDSAAIADMHGKINRIFAAIFPNG